MLNFTIFARDHASRVFDKVGDNAERLGRRIDNAGRSTGGFSANLDGLGRAAAGLGGHLAHAGGQLTSLAASAVTAAAKAAVIAGALSTLAAGAASAAGYTLSLAAALAPLSGLLTGLPGLALTGAAAFGVWKLATGGLGEAMGAALSGNVEALAAALGKLTDTGRAFITEFSQLIPQLNAFKGFAQDPFLEPLIGQMGRWLASARDLGPAIGALAGEFGQTVRTVLDFATSAQSIGSFNSILGGTRDLVAAVRAGLEPLLRGFVDLGVVGNQWLASFAPGLRDVLTTFGQWMSRVAASGQAWSWLDGAVVVLKQLGALFKDVWDILVGLLAAAKTGGGQALGVLGQLVDMFARWVNSAQGQEVLVTVFRALNDVGKALLPIITALGDAVAVIAPQVARLATAMGPVLAQAIAALGPAVAALAPGIIAVIKGIGDAVAAVAPALVPLGQAISTAFSLLRPLLAGLGTAIAALLPGVRDFLTAFATGVAQLAPTLAPLGAALGGILSALSPLLTVIGQVAAVIVQSLAAGIQSVLPSLQLLVSNLGQTLLTLAPIVPLLIEFAATLINSLVPALAPLLPQIATLVTALVGGLVPALTPLIPIIAEIAGIIGQTFVSVLGRLVEVALLLLPPLSEVAQIIGLALLDAVRQLAPHIPGLVSSFLTFLPAVIELLPPLASLAVSLLPRFLDAITQILPLLPGLITNAILLTQAWYPLIPIFTDLLTKLAPHIPLFIELAAVIATQLLPPLIQLSTVVVKMVSEVNKAFQDMYDTLVGHSIIPDLIRELDAWFAKLPGLVLKAVNDAKDAAIKKFGEMVEWISGLPGRIISGLGDMSGLLFGAGRDLVTGFWNGLVSLWNWLVENVQSLFGGLAGWAKSILGIASPSKVFADIGRQLPAGMALGITKASGLVRTAVEGLAGMAQVNATAQIGVAGGAGVAVPIVPQSAPTFVFNFAGQPLVGRDEITRMMVAALNEAKGRGFSLGFSS